MKIKKPFVIEILKKERVHPLQAASNHSGEKMVEMITSGDLGNIEYLPPKRGATVVLNEILLPPRESALFASLPEYLQLRKSPRPEATRNARNNLWMSVNWREKRHDSQFCRQFELVLPTDSTLEQARSAVAQFAESALMSQGMVVDLAIHETPGLLPESAPLSRTAYLMCTMRPFEDKNFANKNRDWNSFGQLIAWRTEWFDALYPILAADSASQATIDLLAFAKRFASKKSHVFQPPSEEKKQPSPRSMRL